MGKQQQNNQNEVPKKRKRVGFVKIDDGVEVSHCLEIYMVSTKEEMESSNGFRIYPVDLSEFFHEGKIFGYHGLKVTIWINSITFHAYADVKFQSSYDGGKGITDLRDAFDKIFAENLVKNKEEFIQKFNTQNSHVRSLLEEREISKASSNGSVKTATTDCDPNESSNVEVVRVGAGSPTVNDLYNCVAPLALLLIDGSNPIDIDDPLWDLYFSIHRKADDRGVCQPTVLGFAAVYRFFRYPDNLRFRLGQILVFPPYQHKGHGRRLIETVNLRAVEEDVYDLTIEEPLGDLQRVRTFVDVRRLRHLKTLQDAVDRAVSCLVSGGAAPTSPCPGTVDTVRRDLKINRKQLLYCWSVLVFLALQDRGEDGDRFTSFVEAVVREDFLGKDSGANTDKKVVEVSGDGVSFVMFRSSSAGQQRNLDGGEGLQRQQLMQLVEERVREIAAVSGKVDSSLGRVS